MFHGSLLAAGRICFGAMAAFLLCGTAAAAAISVNSLADNVFVNVTGQTFSDAAYTVAVTPAYCTLRMAISSANRDAATGGCAAGSGADFITFSPSLNLGTTPGTITLADVAMNTSPYPLPAGLTNPPPLFVVKALTITGPGSTQLTIDGSLAAVSGRRIIAAADFDEKRCRRGHGDFAGAVKQETLRHEVGVVINERFFDQLVERVEGETEGILVAGQLDKIGGDLAADAGDPGTVGVVEDVFFASGEGDVGEGLTEGVGNLGQHEALLAVRAEEDDGRDGDGLRGDHIAPSVVGFLINGGVDGAFEGEIVREGRVAIHGDV